MNNDKPSPICKECSGWMEEITIRNETWRRCMSCGFMEKLVKRIRHDVCGSTVEVNDSAADSATRVLQV